MSRMMQSAEARDLPKLEWGQARLRLLATGVGLIFFAVAGLSHPADLPHWRLGVMTAAGFLAMSIAWAWWVRRYPCDFPLRRLSAVLVDNLMASIATYLGGPLGIVFYPFYLQSIVGHTMRFDVQSLRIASTSAAVGFGTVILASEHWHVQPIMAAALWLGLLILPLHYHVLVRRLQNTKAALERELNKTVYAATHDPLTDLANRGYFLQRLEEIISGSRRNGERFALLYLDLDGFKPINDTLGHAAGDRVLVEVAAVLKECARSSDLAARMGGDEFTLLIRDVADQKTLDTLVCRLLTGIQEAGTRHTGASALSASVGVSLYPEHGTDARVLLAAADSAMYRAKRGGKGQSCLVGREHTQWSDQDCVIDTCSGQDLVASI